MKKRKVLLGFALAVATTLEGLPVPSVDAAGNRLDTTANGIAAEFPFLPSSHDGRNRQRIDRGE